MCEKETQEPSGQLRHLTTEAAMAVRAAAKVSKTASALVGRQLPGDHWDAVHSVYAQARSKGAEAFDPLLLWEFHKAVNVHKWAEGRRAQWRLKQLGKSSIPSA